MMTVGFVEGPDVVVTGGMITTGGAVTRGAITSLLNMQSGPLRSMQAGLASGTLTFRSVVCADTHGATAVKNTVMDNALSFIAHSSREQINSNRDPAISCTAPCIRR